MKRGFYYLSFFCILLLLLGFVSSQAPGLPLENEINNAGKAIDNAKTFTEKDKWVYLSEQWREVLLKNKFISTLDSGLTKISPLFFFLVGEEYSLSLTFLFAVLFWIFFLFMIGEIFEISSVFSSGVSWGLAVIFAIVMGHLGIYKGLSEFAFGIIFYREGIWGWIAFTLFLMILVGAVVGLRLSGKKILNQMKIKKKKRDEKQAEFDRDIIHGTAEAILEGTGAK